MYLIKCRDLYKTLERGIQMTIDVITDERVRQVLEEVAPEIYGAGPVEKLNFFQSLLEVVKFWNKNVFSSDMRQIELSAIIVSMFWGAISGLMIAKLNLVNPDVGASVCLGMVCGFVFPLFSSFGVDGFVQMFKGEEKKMLNDFTKKYLASILFSLTCIEMGILGLFYNRLTGLVMFGLPVLSWFAQAAWVSVKSHLGMFKIFKERKSSLAITPEVVQRRLIDHMKKTIETAVAEVEGSDSLVERRIAELKQKLNRAETIKQYFQERQGMASNSTERQRYERNEREAREVMRLLSEDLQALLGEQKLVLDFFREVETFIPREESRLADDKFEAELMHLRGEAEVSRDTSRETMMRALQPIFDTFLPLEAAREHLKIHALAELEGPGSLARLIKGAEEVGAEVVKMDSRVHDITSRLKAV